MEELSILIGMTYLCLVQTMTEIEIVELKKTVFTFLGDGLIHVRFRDGEVIGIEDYQEGILLLESREQGKRYAFIYDAGMDTLITDELREMITGPGSNRYTLAEAIIVDSLAQRILGNFYMRFNSKHRATRMFSNAQAAETWLRKMMQDFN